MSDGFLGLNPGLPMTKWLLKTKHKVDPVSLFEQSLCDVSHKLLALNEARMICLCNLVVYNKKMSGLLVPVSDCQEYKEMLAFRRTCLLCVRNNAVKRT